MKKIIILFITIFLVLYLAPIFAATQKGIFPVPVLETYIEAPFQPSAVIETNTIQFKLSGKNLRNSKDKVYFETMLFPLDKKWTQLYQTTKTYTKLKQGIYVLFARATKKYNKRIIVDKTPAWIPFKINISSDYKKISLGLSGNGKQLTLYNLSKDPLNITDWKIKSLAGEWPVPRAVKFLDPFFTKNEVDVVLESGEKAVLKTGTSTIGLNFKPNKCLSFMPSSYKMDFSVSGYCRRFSNDELYNLRREKFLTDKCVSFIRAKSCKTPDDKAMLQIQNDNSCVNFVLENFNYKGCYNKYHSERNFLSKDWRIYIKADRFHYQRYDTIRILDRNGLLVTEKKIY